MPAANQCLNPLLFRASLYAVYNICYGEWSFFTVSIIFYLLLGQSHLILSRNTNHLHCLHLLHLLLASVPSQQPQLQHLHIIFTISPENMSEPSRTQLLHLNRLILSTPSIPIPTIPVFLTLLFKPFIIAGLTAVNWLLVLFPSSRFNCKAEVFRLKRYYFKSCTRVSHLCGDVWWCVNRAAVPPPVLVIFSQRWRIRSALVQRREWTCSAWTSELWQPRTLCIRREEGHWWSKSLRVQN